MSNTITLQLKARGERPAYFADPAIDKVLSIALALAGEVAVLRDRLDTVERLAASGAKVSPEAVDRYQPDPAVRAERDAWRERFIEVILRTVHQEREDLQRRNEPYEEAVRLVEAPAQAAP